MTGTTCLTSYDLTSDAFEIAAHTYEPCHEKICLMPYAYNKDASVQSDQHFYCSLPR